MLTNLVCLAIAIYFEAAGEPYAGKLAVAEVVMNRVESPRYPNTPCDVIQQHKQFSFVEEFGMEVPELKNALDQQAWQHGLYAAHKALSGAVYGLTDGAMHYYTPDKANPKWAESMTEVVQIGNHRFMRI